LIPARYHRKRFKKFGNTHLSHGKSGGSFVVGNGPRWGLTKMRRLPWDSSSILASYGQNILLIYIIIVALFDF